MSMKRLALVLLSLALTSCGTPITFTGGYLGGELERVRLRRESAEKDGSSNTRATTLGLSRVFAWLWKRSTGTGTNERGALEIRCERDPSGLV